MYLGHLDYPKEAYKIGVLSESMKHNQFISSVESWYDDLVFFTLQQDDIGK